MHLMLAKRLPLPLPPSLMHIRFLKKTRIRTPFPQMHQTDLERQFCADRKCLPSVGDWILKNSGMPVGGSLELPVLIDGLNSPVKLLSKGLREETLNGNIELLRKDDRETRVDIVLALSDNSLHALLRGLTIFEVPSATSLLLSLSCS